MKIYNTLTKSIEDLIPRVENKINLFVCGPTVYDFPHLGHAKTYTQFDFIARYLRWRGYEVFYLQNITDIDDKIIQRASERGISWEELAREFEKIFIEDMKSLHNTSVDHFARATDHIDHIVSQIHTLMENGYAYEISDGFYFEISKFSEYGKLSGRIDLQENDAVSRIDESEEKRGWNDFCLWKKHQSGEPFWNTSLGAGRPGWHIEDTAITETFFGPQYDMHGGGVDLIFPHHEAEIAQMESASGKKPLVKYWLHTGFINVNTKKMSKSLGNFKTIRDALDTFNYRVLRYFFVSSHYRSSINYNELSLEQAKGALKRIDDFLFSIDMSYDDIENTRELQELKDKLIDYLDYDFDTPRAFAALFDFIRSQNRKGRAGLRVFNFLREINGFLHILDFEQHESISNEIKTLIDKRRQYRNTKLYTKADAIRSQIAEMGYELYDTEAGVKWRKIK